MIPRTSFASHLSSSSHFGRNFCRSGNNLEERTTKEEREGKRDWKKKGERWKNKQLAGGRKHGGKNGEGQKGMKASGKLGRGGWCEE